MADAQAPPQSQRRSSIPPAPNRTRSNLEILEPSPVEETPLTVEGVPEDPEKGYFPSQRRDTSEGQNDTSEQREKSGRQGTRAGQSTSRLGLGSHGTAWWLQQTQRYSSYTFTAFAALHITNMSLIPLITQSVPASSKYLLLTRPYYQSFPLEPLLVIMPLGIHIASGVSLRLYRRHILVRDSGAITPSERKRVSWPRVTWTSAMGFAGTWLVGLHAGVTRLLPLLVDGGSSGVGLDFVGHGVSLTSQDGVSPGWLGLGFYTALVTVVGSHMVWGWSKWLGVSPPPGPKPAMAGTAGNETMLRRKKRWYGGAVATVAVVSVWLAGGVGVVARGGKADGVHSQIRRPNPELTLTKAHFSKKTDAARASLQSFYCTLCNKGYSRQNEFAAHESSYEHNHNQRRKDLKSMNQAMSRGSGGTNKDDAAGGLIKVKPIELGKGATAGEGGKKKGGFKKGGFKSAFGEGEAEVVVDVPRDREGEGDVVDVKEVVGDEMVVDSDEDDLGYECYDPRRPTGCSSDCKGMV
ncbi:MAG: hypothetical protein M1831_007529 [Alyxoria varia]|nr:MAG: hypothetical protein M1831_007529 [Alyxoria varia]